LSTDVFGSSDARATARVEEIIAANQAVPPARATAARSAPRASGLLASAHLADGAARVH